MLVGDVLSINKVRGGFTKMVMEVIGNVFGEAMARMSNLRKRDLKLGGKLTTQGQGLWFHPVKTKYDGK